MSWINELKPIMRIEYLASQALDYLMTEDNDYLITQASQSWSNLSKNISVYTNELKPI